MRPHVVGGTIAAVGGLLIALAAVVPQWWAGPIHIAGRVIHGKTVHISLLRATGCNEGDGSCMGLDVGVAFRVIGLATLLVAVATALAALGLFVAASVRAATARFARLALLGSTLSLAGGVGFFIMVPDRFAEIPSGVSPYGFFVGAILVVISSLMVLLRDPAPPQQGIEPVDIRELLSTDMLRPASLGPEPKLGRYGAVVPDQPPSVAASGPRFRPLYEVEGYRAPVLPALPEVHAPLVAPSEASQWQVDPPNPALAGGDEGHPDPGFDQATMPMQMSLAAMVAAGNDEPGTEKTDRLPSEADAVDDSSVFLRSEQSTSVGHVAAAAPRKASVTLTPSNSASMAALAALSKPAVITIPSTVSRMLVRPKSSELVAEGPTPACPQCDSPMGWVDKHLRYYCSSCRMYF